MFRRYHADPERSSPPFKPLTRRWHGWKVRPELSALSALLLLACAPIEREELPVNPSVVAESSPTSRPVEDSPGATLPSGTTAPVDQGTPTPETSPNPTAVPSATPGMDTPTDTPTDTPRATPPLPTATPTQTPQAITYTPLEVTPSATPLGPTPSPTAPPDVDGDGFSPAEGDCDDTQPGISPSAVEQCNGVDDNCNAQLDEGVLQTFYGDQDGDTFGVASATTTACEAPAGFSADAGDCNDSDPLVYPEAPETCDGLDESCEGTVDEGLPLLTYFPDQDEDGYGDSTQATAECAKPSGYVSVAGDCEDTNAAIHPDAQESCNSLDDDCDQEVDENLPVSAFYVDGDRDFYGAGTPTERCAANSGEVARAGDCDDANPAINPGMAELVCSGADDDCSSASSDHPDADGDGYDLCQASVAGDDDRDADCNDSAPRINPGASDTPGDAVDSNCNGYIDALITLAGNGAPGLGGDGGPGTQAQLNFPYGMAVAADGTVYVADLYSHRIRKLTPQGVVSTVAGTGVAGFSGDSGAASSAKLMHPHAVVLDRTEANLYVADTGNLRVRRIDLATGVITTVAGNGSWGSSATTGKAVDSPFKWPVGVMINPKDGKLFISDASDHVVRKIENNNDIKAYAGNGKDGYAGDGGSAVSASLNGPAGLVGNAAGDVFIADVNNHRIRKVTGASISTVAGSATTGFCGDGGAATSACLSTPSFVTLDSAGNLYISDAGNLRIRRVGTDNKISTLAGTGAAYFSGDGGPAASATFYYPEGLGLDGAGNLYVADHLPCRVRKISGGTITSVFGNGSPGYNPGDTVPTAASLFFPSGVTQATDGTVYFSDHYNHVVRKISPAGVLSTVAGTGVAGFSGDAGQATGGKLNYPFDVELDSSGALFIADVYNCRIRKVTSSGTLSTVAGTSTCGSGGDGGAATSAFLNLPYGIAVDASGTLFIADTYNHRIRKVIGPNIYTVAGTGTQGFSGDTGPALSATLDRPMDVEAGSNGVYYFSAPFQNRVRKVDGAGILTTVAGTGTAGFSGDGGAATSALLRGPAALALDPLGNLFIGDTANLRVRLLTQDGTIRTVAGSGDAGFNVSSGTALGVNLYYPYGLHAPGNLLLIGDQLNERVRKVVF